MSKHGKCMRCGKELTDDNIEDKMYFAHICKKCLDEGIGWNDGRSLFKGASLNCDYPLGILDSLKGEFSSNHWDDLYLHEKIGQLCKIMKYYNYERGRYQRYAKGIYTKEDAEKNDVDEWYEKIEEEKWDAIYWFIREDTEPIEEWIKKKEKRDVDNMKRKEKKKVDKMKRKELKSKLDKVNELLIDEDPAEYGAKDLGDGSYDTTTLVDIKIDEFDNLVIFDGYGDPEDVSDLSPEAILVAMREYADIGE